MSKTRVLLLIIGLVAIGAVVFAGAGRLAASSSTSGESPTKACDTHAKTASSGACTKSSGASASCPVGACAGDKAGKSCSASASMSCGSKAAKTASIESVPYREGKTIVLAGHYVCGHCELGISDKCQPGFQTKDGKNYLLIKNNLSNELRGTAREKDVEIVTRVKKLNGVKYLEVEAVRSLS